MMEENEVYSDGPGHSQLQVINENITPITKVVYHISL
jgi:hypothetical protein